jgi:hypothetical protein
LEAVRAATGLVAGFSTTADTSTFWVCGALLDAGAFAAFIKGCTAAWAFDLVGADAAFGFVAEDRGLARSVDLTAGFAVGLEETFVAMVNSFCGSA